MILNLGESQMPHISGGTGRQKKTLPGVLTAADPFFWFCHGDFYLYTFPANQVGRAFDAVFVCYQISRVHKD